MQQASASARAAKGSRGRAAAYEGSDAEERSEDSAPDAPEPDMEFDVTVCVSLTSSDASCV